MNNKKRSRLEVACTASNAETLPSPLPITMLDDHSFFLSSGSNDCIGTSTNNLLLTICDDQSDESRDILCMDEALSHIKKEEKEVIGGLQYRIVNPLRTSVDRAVATVNTNRLNTMIPTTVQLPSGCDIYLVKEYVEDLEESTCSAAKNAAEIRLETAPHCTGAERGGGKTFARTNVPQLMPKTNVTTLKVDSNNVAYGTDTYNKHNYILETYKKRDDKRRATHNEVERRRRDKINSWIFRLKEMLPDMSSSQTTTSNSNNNALSDIVTTPTSRTASHEHGSGHYSRTPPNDSKSQILIKACEYIKTMQEELKSLRECLSENENLRIINQRLQVELDRFKQNESQNQTQNNNRSHNQNYTNNRASNSIIKSSNSSNDSTNLTLNTLNSNGSIFAATSIATTAYTKRELIIRDYVD